MLFSRAKTEMITAERALHGRDGYAFTVPKTHFVNGRPIQPPFPTGLATAVFGLGCFWGAERDFWQTDGEVCSGLTGHAEVVLAVFDPAATSYERLLATFFEAHDPTQGMRQGNDVGTQYRSAIYVAGDAQRAAAESAKTAYSKRLQAAGLSVATTEIAAAGPFYYAEDYHQQYLAKNPDGYCGLGGTGVSCPVGLFAPEQSG